MNRLEPLPLYPTWKNFEHSKIFKDQRPNIHPIFETIERFQVSKEVKNALYFCFLILKACEYPNSSINVLDDQYLIYFNDEEGYSINYDPQNLTLALDQEDVSTSLLDSIKGEIMVEGSRPNAIVADKLGKVAHDLLKKQQNNQLALYLLTAALRFGKDLEEKDLIILLPKLRGSQIFLTTICNGLLAKNYPSVLDEMIKERNSLYFRAAIELQSKEKIKALLPFIEHRSQQDIEHFYKKFKDLNPFTQLKNIQEANDHPKIQTLFFLFEPIGIKLFKNASYLEVLHFFKEKSKLIEENTTYFYERDAEKLLAALNEKKRPLDEKQLQDWLIRVLNTPQQANEKSFLILNCIIDKINQNAQFKKVLDSHRQKLIEHYCHLEHAELAAKLVTEKTKVSDDRLKKMLASLRTNDEKMTLHPFLSEELKRDLYKKFLREKDIKNVVKLVDQVTFEPDTLHQTVNWFIDLSLTKEAHKLMTAHNELDFGEKWSSLIEALLSKNTALAIELLLKKQASIKVQVVESACKEKIPCAQKLMLLSLYDIQNPTIWGVVYTELSKINLPANELIEKACTTLKFFKEEGPQKQKHWQWVLLQLHRVKSQMLIQLFEKPPLLDECNHWILYRGALTVGEKLPKLKEIFVQQATDEKRKLALIQSQIKCTETKISLASELLPKHFEALCKTLQKWFKNFDTLSQNSQNLLKDIFLNLPIEPSTQIYLLSWATKFSIYNKQFEDKITQLIHHALGSQQLDSDSKENIKTFIRKLIHISTPIIVDDLLNKINRHPNFKEEEKNQLWFSRLMHEKLESNDSLNYFYKNLYYITDNEAFGPLIQKIINKFMADLETTKDNKAFLDCISLLSVKIYKKGLPSDQFIIRLYLLILKLLTSVQEKEMEVKRLVVHACLDIINTLIKNGTNIPKEGFIDLIELITYLTPYREEQLNELIQLGLKNKLYEENNPFYLSLHLFHHGEFPEEINDIQKLNTLTYSIKITKEYSQRETVNKIYSFFTKYQSLIGKNFKNARQFYKDLLESFFIIQQNKTFDPLFIEEFLKCIMPAQDHWSEKDKNTFNEKFIPSTKDILKKFILYMNVTETTRKELMDKVHRFRNVQLT